MGIGDVERNSEEMVRGEMVNFIDINLIEPNPMQFRKHFTGIEELAESIKSKGVRIPLKVTRRGENYRLVCGERRWRASNQAGLKKLPCIIVLETEENTDETGLIENLHREGLALIDEAFAVQEFTTRGYNGVGIAELTGFSPSKISKLLKIAVFFKEALSGGFATYSDFANMEKVGLRVFYEAAQMEDREEAVEMLHAAKAGVAAYKGKGPSVTLSVPLDALDAQEGQLQAQVSQEPSSFTPGLTPGLTKETAGVAAQPIQKAQEALGTEEVLAIPEQPEYAEVSEVVTMEHGEAGGLIPEETETEASANPGAASFSQAWDADTNVLTPKAKRIAVNWEEAGHDTEAASAPETESEAEIVVSKKIPVSPAKNINKLYKTLKELETNMQLVGELFTDLIDIDNSEEDQSEIKECIKLAQKEAQGFQEMLSEIEANMSAIWL